ncbi:MAG: hypothetical protein MUO97_10265, partial [Dehalococcoidia bacterium]|nr:hypothetical protein [Dehalococcoidia bacterium]
RSPRGYAPRDDRLGNAPGVIASPSPEGRGNLGGREDMRFFPFTSFRVRMTGRRLRLLRSYRSSQ